MWGPEVARARHRPLKGLKGKDHADAMADKRAASEIHSLLFPKDD